MPPWSKVLTSALSPNGVSRIIGCEEGNQWSETEPNKMVKYPQRLLPLCTTVNCNMEIRGEGGEESKV